MLVIYTEKYSLVGVETLALRMDIMEIPAAKATDVVTPWRVPRDIGALATLKTFLNLPFKM